MTALAGLDLPVYLKDEETWSWPEGVSAFYLLTGSGLFLCREQELFRSCAPATCWPAQLARHESTLVPRYPRIPRPVMEQIVGFFGRMADDCGCEAAVHLLWNRQRRQMRIEVPEQTAEIRRSWKGEPYPVGLEFGPAVGLADGDLVLGDVHSHVFGAAYASGVDVHDEVSKPGLHVVVGRLDREPPDLHVEAVVDGARFRLTPERVIDDYGARCGDVPQSWLDRVRVVERTGWWSSGSSSWRSGQ